MCTEYDITQYMHIIVYMKNAFIVTRCICFLRSSSVPCCIAWRSLPKCKPKCSPKNLKHNQVIIWGLQYCLTLKYHIDWFIEQAYWRGAIANIPRGSAWFWRRHRYSAPKHLDERGFHVDRQKCYLPLCGHTYQSGLHPLLITKTC